MNRNPDIDKPISENEYKEELSRTDTIIQAAMRVSLDSGGIKTSNRFIAATQLYTRLVVVSMTYMRILPFNRFVTVASHHTDWPSVATLCRSMIEIYLSFFYIGLEHLSEEEADFRLSLFHYHQNSEKYKYFKDISSVDVIKEFEENLPKDRQELYEKAMQLKLTVNQRKRALSGNYAHYLTRNEILSRIPFDTSEIPHFYRFFSYQVHSTPFAFLSQSNERGRGEPNPVELEYIVFTMWIVRKYVSSAIIGMHTIFPYHYRDAADTTLMAAFVLAKQEFDAIIKENEAGA